MGSLHTTWNTNKEGGWVQYKEDTEKNEKLLDISVKKHQQCYRLVQEKE